MENQARATEKRSEESRQRSRHLAKLSEYQHLLLFGGNHFSDLPQTRPLAAVCLAPCPIAQPLGRVIANLLEPRQEGEDQTLTLDTLSVIEQPRQFFDRLLIKRRLFSRELAKRLDLDLLRQIGNHRFVGLQPPQYVRP